MHLQGRTSLLNSLQQVIDKLGENEIQLVGDFNAKSPVWGNPDENMSGSFLLDFCSANNFLIVNNEDSIPISNGHQGMSWIDLSLTRFKTKNSRIIDWEVKSEETFLDHQEISFCYKEQKGFNENGKTRFNIKSLN